MRRLTCLFLLSWTLGACAANPDADPDGIVDEQAGDPNTADDPNAEPGDGTGTVTEAISSGLIDAEEAAFLTRINDYRAASGLQRLRISVALSRAAHAHSADMATHNYFAHDSQDGRTFDQRLRNAGYTYNTVLAENLVAGSADAAGAFTQWRNSPDHNVNMLNPDVRVIGIGRAHNPRSEYGWYWTTNFGGQADALTSHGFGTVASNGGFEAATAGTATWNSVRTRGNWYLSNAARATPTPSAGAYQMTLNDPNPGAASATQIVLGAPGIHYTFSAVSRRVSGTTNQALYIEFLNSSYARLALSAVAAASGTTYARATVRRTAPPGTAYVRVFLYGPPEAGTRSSFTYDSALLTAE